MLYLVYKRDGGDFRLTNLYKEKLKGNQIGVFFLTGAPMHLGHYQNIMQAKKENDGCVVILSGYDGDRGDLIGLPLRKRFQQKSLWR